jgi:hypothetical protein
MYDVVPIMMRSFELKEGNHTLYTTYDWEDKFIRFADKTFNRIDFNPRKLRMCVDRLKLKIQAKESNKVPYDVHEFAYIMT